MIVSLYKKENNKMNKVSTTTNVKLALHDIARRLGVLTQDLRAEVCDIFNNSLTYNIYFLEDKKLKNIVAKIIVSA